MTRALLPAAALLFVAGCNATVNGKLVDGLTGEPVPGKPADAGEEVKPLRVIAKSTFYAKKGESGTPVEVPADDPEGKWQDNPTAGMTCMSFAADVNTDGTFSLSGLCLSQTAYDLELSDKNWFLAETNKLEKGQDVSGGLELKAWRSPMGTGLNVLAKDNTLEPVRSRQKLKVETIKGTVAEGGEGEKVYYPEGLPAKTPVVEPGQYLVVSGPTYKDAKLVPLVHNPGKIEFAIPEGYESGPSLSNWAFLGTKFTDSETYERVDVSMAADKVVTKEKDGHIARFIPAEAVPAGRYALQTEGNDTIFIIDFQKAYEIPKAAPAEGEGEGDGEGGE